MGAGRGKGNHNRGRFSRRSSRHRALRGKGAKCSAHLARREWQSHGVGNTTQGGGMASLCNRRQLCVPRIPCAPSMAASRAYQSCEVA